MSPAELLDSRAVAAAMAAAAADWMSGLDPDQRRAGLWGAPGGIAERERRRWFYTPTDHGGLPLSEQSPVQQRRAMALVASGLSTEGYDLVSVILGTENILDRVEGFSSQFDTARGRDPSRYYLRVFGDPTVSSTWGWRFGGHHVSLNFLVIDGEVRATTPRFLGLDPAVSPLPGGAELAPLSGFTAAADQLLSSLDATALEAAVLLDRAPSDIVLGNRPAFEGGAEMMRLHEVFRRRRGDEDLIERLRLGGEALNAKTGLSAEDHAHLVMTNDPRGVSASLLGPAQRRHLEALVSAYQEPLVHALRRAWDADELHFAWAGPPDVRAPHYYRIQGDGLLIEWDNTSRDANHAHGVVREISNDFGGDPLSRHLDGWHRPHEPEVSTPKTSHTSDQR